MAAKFVFPSYTKIVLTPRQFSKNVPFITKKLFLNSRRNRSTSNFSYPLSETLEKVKESLAAIANDKLPRKTTSVFVGTGQYYDHETNERIVVISLGENGNLELPIVLHDTSLPRGEVDKLEKELNSLSEVGSVHSGELDSVQDSPWKFGFTCKPSFSIFSTSGFCCQFQHSSVEGECFRIFDEHMHLHEDVLLSEIEHIQVSLSPEPWEEGKLQLKMKNVDLISVLEDCEENISNENGLASLMLTTEWMVKAAGHMCVTARQFGATTVSLKLPSVLRADVNPWVAMRNKIWAEKNSES